jgi:hypothetical protein
MCCAVQALPGATTQSLAPVTLPRAPFVQQTHTAQVKQQQAARCALVARLVLLAQLAPPPPLHAPHQRRLPHQLAHQLHQAAVRWATTILAKAVLHVRVYCKHVLRTCELCYSSLSFLSLQVRTDFVLYVGTGLGGWREVRPSSEQLGPPYTFVLTTAINCLMWLKHG